MRIPPFVLLLVGLLAWASAACSSGDEVGDMALILESGPEVVEITARSARVIAATSIDVVCSVAFGTTEEYGQLATDDDMAGTGHSVHGPLLSGLMPDTEYHFTLGGHRPRRDRVPLQGRHLPHPARGARPPRRSRPATTWLSWLAVRAWSAPAATSAVAATPTPGVATGPSTAIPPLSGPPMATATRGG